MAIHVIAKLGGGWAVRKSRAKRALKLFRLKRDALRFAREQAGGSNFFTHRIDGTIEQFGVLYGREALTARIVSEGRRVKR